MGLQIYKANKAVKGCAAHFNFNSKLESVFIEMIRQTGWNDATGSSSFQGGDKVKAKFGVSEIAGMIDALERNVEWSGFHSFEGNTTTIKLSPYIIDNAGTKVQKGFGFSISQSINGGEKKSLMLSLNFGEMRLLREYFAFALDHIFSHLYSEDKKNFEKRQKDKAAQSPTQTEAPPTLPEI